MIYNVDTDNKEMMISVKPFYSAEQRGYKDDVINVSDDDYTPSKGDKLYFLPGASIPRVKLKDLSLKHEIKSVRNIDDATHIFCSNSTLNKITNKQWHYYMPTETLKNIIADPDCYMDDYYRENLTQALEFYTEDQILVDYSSATELRNSSLQFLNKHITGDMLRYSSTFYTIDKDYEELFPKILNISLLNESKLLKYINGTDAPTIDEEMFLRISEMFNSSDQDNHILAMEIMANSNYMESLLYVEMLFEQYEYRMRDCHTKNHVNFKSLLSFLNKDKRYMSTNIDDVVKSLIDKEVLDLDKIEVIMKYYGERIANMGGTEHFKVKSLTLNESLAKELNVNYSHYTAPDFIPEGVPQVENEVTEDSVTVIDNNEADLDVIETEEQTIISESELNKESKALEGLSNNHQIEEKNDTDFEWF